MKKLFLVKDMNYFLQNEDAKKKGFTFESAASLKLKEEGFVFLFDSDEAFFKHEMFKNKDVKEITGKDKEKALKEFERIEEEKISGIGGLF